jgi:holo-[acyl-carrier protein] synthase
VVSDNGTPPEVVVTGPTRELMAARGVNHIMLTTAYSRAFATATAIALKVAVLRAAEDTALDD